MVLIEDLLALLAWVVHAYVWAIILAALFSMLAAFNVIDTRNRLVWSIGDFLYRITEPVLRPIRRLVPSFGNIDITPWIAVLVLQFLVEPLIVHVEVALRYGSWQQVFF
jgi:YggT family protein